MNHFDRSRISINGGMVINPGASNNISKADTFNNIVGFLES
ncbi:MAG: hypothetical protein ACK5Z5_00965 [Neisseriaceae bacterium]